MTQKKYLICINFINKQLMYFEYTIILLKRLMKWK